jgi:hypothetical protein
MNKAMEQDILRDIDAMIDSTLDLENEGLIIDELIKHYERMCQEKKYAYVVSLAARVRMYSAISRRRALSV